MNTSIVTMAPVPTSTSPPSGPTTSTPSSTTPTAPDTPVDASTQTFRLPDGRTLAYSTFGDPNGLPLVYLHGFPSSRLEGIGLDALGWRRGVRVIAPDRPGFGLSDPVRSISGSSPSLSPTSTPGNAVQNASTGPHTTNPTSKPTSKPKLANYASDIGDLITHLGLSKPSVLGVSGGGPYAIACAAALPLRSVGVMACGPAWEASSHVGIRMAHSRRIMAFFASSAPGVLALALGAAARLASYGADTRSGNARLDAWIGSVQDQHDPAEVRRSIPEQRERFKTVLREPFRQGARATVVEANLLAQNWGIEFDKVDYPVQFFHGRKDSAAPIEMVRWLVEQLPNATLLEWSDRGHYDLGVAALDEVVSELLPEARK